MRTIRKFVPIILCGILGGPLACGPVMGNDEGAVKVPDTPDDPEEVDEISELPRASAEPIEAFSLQPQSVLDGTVESTYLDVETWLTVATSPSRERIALATSSTVEVYSMPEFQQVWSKELPAGSVYAFHGLFDPPLLAFSDDGATVAWLSGRQGESISVPAHVLVELNADTGEALDAIAFQVMKSEGSTGPTEGQPTPPNPNHLQYQSDGKWLVGNPYSIVRVHPADKSAVKLKTVLTGTELSQAASGWSVVDGGLAHEDGRTIELECRKKFARLDVAENLEQAAVQCLGPDDDQGFSVLLVDLLELEVLNTWPAPAQVHALPRVMPGDNVLSIEKAQSPGDVMVLHLLTAEGEHQKMSYGEDAWTTVEN